MLMNIHVSGSKVYRHTKVLWGQSSDGIKKVTSVHFLVKPIGIPVTTPVELTVIRTGLSHAIFLVKITILTKKKKNQKFIVPPV